jgi:hypothetical protein
MAFKRKVWTDASGVSSAAVFYPDFIVVCQPLSETISTMRELEVVLNTAQILEPEQHVPTVFYSDCKTMVDAVTRGTQMGKLEPYQEDMLDAVRTYFKGGKWRLEWIKRERNRQADKWSRRTGPYCTELVQIKTWTKSKYMGTLGVTIPEASKVEKPNRRTYRDWVLEKILPEPTRPPAQTIVPATKEPPPPTQKEESSRVTSIRVYLNVTYDPIRPAPTPASISARMLKGSTLQGFMRPFVGLERTTMGFN